eukprot:TRINITY_DN32570_c0_g1_i13.p1 TRINITY_DN32570_c0_g1~~TRINITY_DN32570_c0_g1_i13.p1  ORF type:complete len:268 (+),score=8.32 TRINITY_DN32570_c0_g1_i13:327-1130(+)
MYQLNHHCLLLRNTGTQQTKHTNNNKKITFKKTHQKNQKKLFNSLLDAVIIPLKNKNNIRTHEISQAKKEQFFAKIHRNKQQITLQGDSCRQYLGFLKTQRAVIENQQQKVPLEQGSTIYGGFCSKLLIFRFQVLDYDLYNESRYKISSCNEQIYHTREKMRYKHYNAFFGQKSSQKRKKNQVAKKIKQKKDLGQYNLHSIISAALKMRTEIFTLLILAEIFLQIPTKAASPPVTKLGKQNKKELIFFKLYLQQRNIYIYFTSTCSN